MSRVRYFTQAEDEYIASHCGCQTSREIGEALGRHHKSIQKRIAALRRKGLLHQTAERANKKMRQTALDTIAAEAQAAGMSYGQYVAVKGI